MQTASSILDGRSTPTPDQIKAAFRVVLAVSETIREAGSAPAGLIYTALMTKGVVSDLAGYEAIERTLLNTKLVKKQNDLLIWVGPEVRQ